MVPGMQECRLGAKGAEFKDGILSTAVPSAARAYRVLKAFAARWRACGRPRLTVLAFDVSKAFDNVDVASLRQLVQGLVVSDGWQLRRVQTSVQSRGQLLSK
jgi:hypothetical protein